MGNAGQLFNCMIMNLGPSDDMCADRGRRPQGHRRLVHRDAAPLPGAHPVLPGQRHGHRGGAGAADVRQRGRGHAGHRLVPHRLHQGAGRDVPHRHARPGHAAAGEAKYIGIHNATFALGVSSVSENPDTAFALLDFLSDPQIAGQYGDDTAQFVTVKDVEYTNEDLGHMSEWVQKETLLAPRFQFDNLDIRNAAEGACIEVVGGKSPEQAAEDAQQIIDQQIGN